MLASSALLAAILAAGQAGYVRLAQALSLALPLGFAALTVVRAQVPEHAGAFAGRLVVPAVSIAGEEERSVKIDPRRCTCQQASGRHSQRSAHHTANQQFESAFACALAQAECFSQPAGFVELHVDHFVTILQARNIGSRVATFIGADRNWMVERFENFIGIGWKRLFDQFDG